MKPPCAPSMNTRRNGSAIVIIVGFLLLVAAVVVFVFLPVYRDREIRVLAISGVMLGTRVSDQILAARLRQGRWPDSAAKYLPDEDKNIPAHVEGVRVLDDGLVRVSFKAPEELRGKAVEIRTFQKDGKYFRECRAPGVQYGYLPGWCRDKSEAIPVDGAK